MEPQDISRKYKVGQRVHVSEFGWSEVTSVDDQGFTFKIYTHGHKIGSGYSPHKSVSGAASSEPH